MLLNADVEQTRRNDLQATKIRREQMNAEKKKEKNRIIHSKPGTVKVKAARKKKLIAELE
jgi:DDB1- and CUL4-associated factor 13